MGKMARIIPLFGFVLFGSVLFAGDSDSISQAELIESASVIAVIEIQDAKPSRMNDASIDLTMFKQRATAETRRILVGTLPATFTIENEANSVISNGSHLAFLRPLSDSRYILTSPVSLRRIIDGKAYWFQNAYVDVEKISLEIQNGKK